MFYHIKNLFLLTFIYLISAACAATGKNSTDKAFVNIKNKINKKTGQNKHYKKERIIYFAYGSNMFYSRLQERVPSAVPLGIAILENYSLVWHKKSRDGSTKCNIIKSDPDDKIYDGVYGVLYKFDPKDKPFLDKAEGLGHGYDERKVKVLYKGNLITASTYYATNIAKELLPYAWYKALVVRGAKLNKLPKEYIKMLLMQLTQSDENLERKKQNTKILNNYTQQSYGEQLVRLNK